MADTNGFPTRPVRDAFGPDPVNQYPVRDPNKELDGETIGRLMMHQLSGMGQTVDLADLIFVGSTQAISYRSEAWNPKRVTIAPFANPGIVRSSAGLYVVTYEEEYPDHKGTAQPCIFRGGTVTVLDNDGARWSWRVVPSNPFSSVVTVYTWKDIAGTWTATDCTLLLTLK
jgi:hypothetical protein